MTMQDLDKINDVLFTKNCLDEVKQLVLNDDEYFALQPRLKRYVSKECQKTIKKLIVADLHCQIEESEKQLEELGIEI